MKLEMFDTLLRIWYEYWPKKWVKSCNFDFSGICNYVLQMLKLKKFKIKLLTTLDRLLDFRHSNTIKEIIEDMLDGKDAKNIFIKTNLDPFHALTKIKSIEGSPSIIFRSLSCWSQHQPTQYLCTSMRWGELEAQIHSAREPIIQQPPADFTQEGYVRK